MQSENNTSKYNHAKNSYAFIYYISKVGIVYTIIQGNWIAAIGFSIASVLSYIEMMKRI